VLHLWYRKGGAKRAPFLLFLQRFLSARLRSAVMAWRFVIDLSGMGGTDYENSVCAAALVALLLFLPSHGCTSVDTRRISGPDSLTQQIDMGFTGDLGIAPTMGHSVPLEGEIISTPPCVSETKTGQDCRD